MTHDLPEGELHVLQQAFHECHALQCGFCTPGFLMSLEPLLLEERELSDEEIREELAGNLCRCTGYQNIVAAVRLAMSRAKAPAVPSEPNGRTEGTP
jgi:aerobic-type carbon monoxide dehydrogenase small subunit (CoxS/CutS family)